MLGAFAGHEFLEQNKDELVHERMPYFGKFVLEHGHFAAWAKWAEAGGLPMPEGFKFGTKMKEYLFKQPNPK